jgi:hypothetical protein
VPHADPRCSPPPHPTPQVYELLTDLQTAYASGSEYFLGAIVTTRPDADVTAPYQVGRPAAAGPADGGGVRGRRPAAPGRRGSVGGAGNGATAPPPSCMH